MDDKNRFTRDSIRSGSGLEREKVKYEADPIRDVHDVWVVKQTPYKRDLLANMDSPPISPFIELQVAERTLHNTENRLTKKRKEISVMREKLQSEWDDLYLKERALKENFKAFSKFLKTNLEKRERAIKKIQADSIIVKTRTTELNSLRRKYELRLEDLELLKEEIKKHYLYQNFLEKVVDSTQEGFKDIDDLPKRMEVLMLAREKLQIRQADQLSSLECAKKNMELFLETKRHQILGLNNSIATLQYSHDDAVNRTVELDNLVVNLKNTILNYDTELRRNKDGISNLYRHMSKKHKLSEKQRKKDTYSQLMEISHIIKGYKTIFKLFERKSVRISKILPRVR